MNEVTIRYKRNGRLVLDSHKVIWRTNEIRFTFIPNRYCTFTYHQIMFVPRSQANPVIDHWRPKHWLLTSSAVWFESSMPVSGLSSNRERQQLRLNDPFKWPTEYRNNSEIETSNFHSPRAFVLDSGPWRHVAVQCTAAIDARALPWLLEDQDVRIKLRIHDKTSWTTGLYNRL